MSSTANDQPRTTDQTPEIRVFISSTFRDMQNEREYLIKHIFPELRQICRDRGVQFTEIDLRWGVTREEAEQGKVLKICLDEINRCRPYFIGILGERYGWTPRLEDVRKDTELVEEHPWIEGAINANVSVTEMEILYGVLDNKSMDEHAFFYFRDPERTNEAFKESDEELRSKLHDLKDRIRASTYPVREDFGSPEALGKLVREDLLRVIDEMYPLENAPTPLERERRVHEAFALTRRSSYVARQEYLDELERHATGTEQPLVVVGEPGSGKSALLAFWVHDYRLRHPDAFIVEHYIGATSSGGGHLAVIERIIQEIKDRYSLEEDVPTTPEGLEQEFPSWLAKVQHEPMILIIDALNQLSGNSNELRWMPRHVHSNVRAFFSTISGTTREALRKRGWREMLVNLLTEEEREKLIRHYLGKFRKALSPEQRQTIAADPNCANPLFLRTVLEELRIFGSFERLDERIDYYVSASDVSDLFQRVLSRLEEDYGHTTVENVLSLIWSSRRGLSEPELLEITGLSRVDLSTFLLALEYQLMQRGGLLDFYHDFLRSAVDYRYLGNSSERHRGLHLRIADYFEEQPISSRKADELPWQLVQAQEIDRLKRSLADIGMFLEFAPEEKQYDLLGYWLAAGDLAVMDDVYQQAIELLEENTEGEKDRFSIYDKLGNFMEVCGRYKSAESLLRRAVTICESNPNERETILCMRRLAGVLMEQGNYTEAGELLERIRTICEEEFGSTGAEAARTLMDLGKLARLKGEYGNARDYFERAHDIYTGVYGPDHHVTATSLKMLAVTYEEQGNVAQAEPLYRQVIEIRDRVLGSNHPFTADCIYNLATNLWNAGRLDEAEPLFHQSLDIWKNVYGDDHPATAMGYNNLAVLYRHKGDFEAAEPLYRKTLSIWEELFGPEHLYSAMTLTNLAELMQDRKDFEAGERIYTQARLVYEQAVGEEHPYTAYALHGLGTLFRDKGEHHLAEPHFVRALEIRENALGAHPETAETLEEYASVLRALERLEEASAVDERLRTLRASLS